MHRTAAEYMHNMALIISNYILFVLLLIDKEGQMSCVIARNYGKLTSSNTGTCEYSSYFTSNIAMVMSCIGLQLSTCITWH